MTTQLRLVDPPESRPRPAAGARTRGSKAGASKGAPKGAPKGVARTATRRARTASARAGRRAASWGDWHLDAGTRQIGRAGVARARQALEAVVETDLDHGLRAS
ncbi:MAG TPA: hypothetical protein VFW97_14630 [Acidimicrobiia bacterium]|nr:hypothetical protein [Acidimicrobiia bacterium]